MNWVDLAVLAVILLSGLFAFMRGLVREVLGVGAWIVAALVASPYGLFPYVQPWVRQQFSNPTTADIVAFGGVFVITLILLWLVAGTISGLIRGSVLGGLDRTLGLVFGLARGVVIIAAAYIVAGIAIPVAQWPEPVVDARSLPIAHRTALWLTAQVPPRYRPEVVEPPAGRPTTSAALLQSNPTGRAFGPRRARD